MKLSTFFNGTTLSFFLLATGILQGAKPAHHWKLDAPTSADFTPKGGRVQLVSGVKGKSLALDGGTVLELKNSAKLTHVEKGFTFFTWVNPYRLNAGQQMIVAKNVYAKNHREWSVMVDRDNRFTLYLYQGGWQTVKADTPVKLGHWFQVGVVIKPEEAELWVNGKREGTRKLTKPLPQTAAPFTLGGVNDNGRIWQNLFGALDEAWFYNRPLSPREITGLYRPVAATHKLPSRVAQGSEGFPLWGGSNLPKTSQAEVLKGVQFHVIKKWERKVDGYGFLHGVALAWHKGKLYASFGHNKGSENTLTEEGRYCVSEDGGKTWSKVQTIDVGVGDDNLAVSHGVFLSRGQTLWAFLGSFYGTRKGVHTRAYTLDEKNGQWQPQGTVVKDGFWPMTESMKQEPVALFAEMLQRNLPVMDFLHSDYAMVNDRLAKHYGLPEVIGNDLRSVKLPSGGRRGGVLTQAGLLAMNSNGKDSHPLKRGIWLLENLLNDPPPPPPPDPPKIDLTDPEILKLTLKQRMEDHRNDPACISCHVKIDPWGIAFENFDAVGKWRDTIGRDPVDATSVLFNKHELRGMQGLKEYLLANRQDQFARAMAHKMAAYALGRPLTFGDRSQVDSITAKLRKQGDGLADLVFLIVKSDLFQLN